MGTHYSCRPLLRNALLIALALGPRLALAQPLPTPEAKPSASTTMHTVTLRGATSGATWEIYPPEGSMEEQTPLARCGERGCTLQMRSGSYRLSVSGPARSGIAEGYRELEITSDLDVTARAPNGRAKSGGLALAIVGMSALAIGSFVTYIGLIGECVDDDEYDDDYCDGYDVNEKAVGAGLVLTLGGAVATPIGWVTFARNRHPRLTPTNGSTLAAHPHPSLQLGVQRFGAVCASSSCAPYSVFAGYGVSGRLSF